MADREIVFVDGMSFKKPREGAPEFVKGNISIKVDAFTDWLALHGQGKEWLNIDLKKSREGKLYLSLNTYEKKKEEGYGWVGGETDNTDIV